MESGGDLYERIVDAANAIYGSHSHTRALHAKGLWCEGTFTASDEAGRLSRAAHFKGGAVPALVRFSIGGGNPEANDGAREARGLAVKLRPDGEETDILATTSIAFSNRTPEDFLELLELRRPDPETGQPDMAKLGAWLGEHPEAQTAIQSILGVGPPASYATATYYSPHAFKLVDADGNETWVKYRWRPEAGEERLEDEEAKARGRDFLRSELTERLGDGPVGFELLLQVAEGDDSLEDPTVLWPDERELVSGGRLEITEVVDDPETGGDVVVFDPTRVIDGIGLSDDPVLHARSRAYSVSIDRRASS